MNDNCLGSSERLMIAAIDLIAERGYNGVTHYSRDCYSSFVLALVHAGLLLFFYTRQGRAKKVGVQAEA
ncbi:hypothetical protein [uncultured Brevibacillus sp.]|uniref:hypothetical protein n=1 Tax=uncultured Brevibacillus sp. TaxID=169970 RepID=UPI002593FFEC|nr:hypothetical protein [uncultured Brevibacillus sp.]